MFLASKNGVENIKPRVIMARVWHVLPIFIYHIVIFWMLVKASLDCPSPCIESLFKQWSNTTSNWPWLKRFMSGNVLLWPSICRFTNIFSLGSIVCTLLFCFYYIIWVMIHYVFCFSLYKSCFSWLNSFSRLHAASKLRSN